MALSVWICMMTDGYINDFISCKINLLTDLDDSFCEISQDDDFLFLNFQLSPNDCLFELEENNYHLFIQIKKGYFEKYREVLFLPSGKHYLCCNTQQKALEIIHSNPQDIFEKIQIESNILFLIHQLQKRKNNKHTDCGDGCTCDDHGTHTDAKNIHQVKEYILKNLASKLTIPTIAGHIGTNQCYLKKGFKEKYNQTIFEFIHENRMQKAQQLLQTANPNITEIAFQVGYSSLSSFSQSYKKFFGVAPTTQIRQQIPN
ncbi:MAG: AraC family transcriptional regulator [Bacteroidia bacterium]|nr:AraC family transcriptional regulator [Bacteroidia bacterium]